MEDQQVCSTYVLLEILATFFASFAIQLLHY